MGKLAAYFTFAFLFLFVIEAQSKESPNSDVLSITSGERSVKKGLVIPSWPRHICHDFEAFDTPSWWYNYHTYENVTDINKWWCNCPSGKAHGDPACFPSDPKEMVFIPMIYGIPGQGHRPDDHDPDVADYMDTVLAYNEPNQKVQSDISPEDAAFHYAELSEKYKDKILVSPATAGIDTRWMDDFMEACELLDCKIDYIATHEYLKVGDEQKTMDKLKAFSERYGGRKIWLTEFAVRNTHEEDDVIGVIENLLPMLEEAEYIWRYSWFISRYYNDPVDETSSWWLHPINSLLDYDDNSLNNLSPTLTKVGEAYDRAWHLQKRN